MNIIYITNYYYPNLGAAALNTQAIISYLIKAGHNILVLAPSNMAKSFNINQKESKKKDNLIIKYSSSLVKFPFNLVFSHFENFFNYVLKYQKSFKPDLIISQYHAFHYASVLGGYLSKCLNIPFIVRSHDIFIDLGSHSRFFRLYNQFSYPLIYKSIMKSDIFYVTTSEMIDYFRSFKKMKDVDFRVHHNGIDSSLFYPYKNQSELKEKYNCENIITFIGLISEDIGVQNLIKVFPEVVKDIKDVKLLLIGDGPFKDNILTLIRKLDLENNVEFLGIKPHEKIPFYVNNSDFGIGRITHKKIWRYMIPVKCLEYMACKKPFITTPISEDVIKNEDVGLLLSRDFSDDELINTLIKLIEDKKLQRKLGDLGKSKIQEEFMWDDLMEKFNKELQNLVEK